VEPSEGELANTVSKIPGSSHCADEDVNDWLNCDRDDSGYDIMTDEETVHNLSKEVNADDNEDDVDKEEQNVPSHRIAIQVLDLAIAWMEQQQQQCDPTQLHQVKRIRNLAARKHTSATKQKTIIDFIK